MPWGSWIDDVPPEAFLAVPVTAFRARRGEDVSIRFDEPGTYHYVRTLHRQDLGGEVIVR